MNNSILLKNKSQIGQSNFSPSKDEKLKVEGDQKNLDTSKPHLWNMEIPIMSSKLKKVVDNLCSKLIIDKQECDDDKFYLYKLDHSQRLLDNFLEVGFTGISVAFVFRLSILDHENTMLDLKLPLGIWSIMAMLFVINKNTD